MPKDAKEALNNLIRYEQVKEAMRMHKFFKDMYQSLLEMNRISKKAKYVIIIGNNHYKLDDHYVEVKNDEVVKKREAH